MTTRKLRIKPRKFNISDETYKVIKKELKAKCRYKTTKGEIDAVWSEFKKERVNELFETGELKLGANIGDLFIYKLPVTELTKAIKNKIIDYAVKDEKLNLQRVGQYYFIGYERHNNISERVKFKPCDEIKKRLTQILKTTNKEYKPAPLRYYKN